MISLFLRQSTGGRALYELDITIMRLNDSTWLQMIMPSEVMHCIFYNNLLHGSVESNLYHMKEALDQVRIEASRKHSLFWVGTLDVQASSVSKISLVDSEEFPIAGDHGDG